MRRAVKAGMTTVELAELDAKRAAEVEDRNAKRAEAVAQEKARLKALLTDMAEVFEALVPNHRTDAAFVQFVREHIDTFCSSYSPITMVSGFNGSLAMQLLTRGTLSPRQAHFVLKIVFGRRNKRNAEAFDALANKLEGIE